jgi:pyrroloquinoline quinone (PQQ) biosynthesis protein C
MANPARKLERFLAPQHALHHQWWSWLLASSGANGWRRVAVQVYHFMNIANHLLRTAIHEANRCDSTHDSFLAWAREHAREEGAHPAWLLEDLSAIGCRREDILASGPDPELRELTQNQLALLQNSSPTAVLGLYFATECHPPDAEALRQIARRLGIPRKALRTLLHHSHVDQEHGKEIFQLVATHGRNPLLFRGMVHGAHQCVNSWIQLMQRYSLEAMAEKTSSGACVRLEPTGELACSSTRR